jgi:metal-responsive CopG/Arc/MetJ family transcriptional regulator
MPTPDKVRFELTLSAKLLALVDAAARERECSRADVIRDLIRSLATQAARS